MSVLMAAYNVRSFIEQAVEDVLSQTYTNLELVICDDGSTDGTREWLEDSCSGDSRVRLYFQERNLGHVANKNFAYAHARGEFITQQDADDVSDRHRIEKQVTALAVSGCKIAACGYYRLTQTGRRIGDVSAGDDRIIEKKSEDDYPFWFPAVMASREVIERTGPLDPYFTGCFGEDLYWTVRANERFPIICLAEPLYGYRVNPTSVTSVLDDPRKLVMPGVLKELLRQRAETGTDLLEQGRLEELSDLERRLAGDRRYIAEQKRIWAARALDEGNISGARRLLLDAWKSWPANATIYRTALYYFRRFAFG